MAGMTGIAIAHTLFGSVLHGLLPAIVLQAQYNATSWVPLASIAVLTVMIISAFVYQLSGLVNSQQTRVWARIQFYEAVLSLVLLVLFGAFSYLFFINPQPIFGACGLDIIPGSAVTQGSRLAPGCASTLPDTGLISAITGALQGVLPDRCNNALDVYQLSVCDLSLFNNAGLHFANAGYVATYAAALLPEIDVSVNLLAAGKTGERKANPVPQLPEEGMPPDQQQTSAQDALGLSFNYDPIPFEIKDIFTYLYAGFLGVMMLNQLQLLLLSGSLLFLTTFMTLGLVARTFGVTRSFGGAMIAFGLGLGFVYPLLVSITYGFINVGGNLSCLTTYPCTAALVSSLFLIMIAGAIGTTINNALGAPLMMVVFGQLGYIVAGFTFIPFLNFTILDTFIVDMSKAMGEKMDFLTLLTSVI